MNMKKVGAVVVSAIMAVGMLAGCGVTAGGSLDLGGVNDLLASSGLNVSDYQNLDNAVASVASQAANMDEDAIANAVANKMKWSIQGNVQDNVVNYLLQTLNPFSNGNYNVEAKYGATYVVTDQELAAGVNPADLGLSNETASVLGPIDSVDDVAAAMVLRQNAIVNNPINPASTYGLNWGNIGNIVGGVIDQGKDWVEDNKDEIEDAIDQGKDWVEDNKDEIGNAVGGVIDQGKDWVEDNKDEINNAVGNAGNAVGGLIGDSLQKYMDFTYSVSAAPFTTQNGSAWIVSVQVTAKLK